MKRLIAVALLSLCLVVQADAHHKDRDYAKIIRYAGCHAKLVTSDEHSVIESYYNSENKTMYIGTQPEADLPEDEALIIVLHETGHCQQDQEGLLADLAPAYFDPTPIVTLELDADRRAADMACRMGKDGRGLLRDVFIWVHDKFGYNGDYLHGTLEQRISQGRLALSCEKPQSPFVVVR